MSMCQSTFYCMSELFQRMCKQRLIVCQQCTTKMCIHVYWVCVLCLNQEVSNFHWESLSVVCLHHEVLWVYWFGILVLYAVKCCIPFWKKSSWYYFMFANSSHLPPPMQNGCHFADDKFKLHSISLYYYTAFVCFPSFCFVPRKAVKFNHSLLSV